MVVWTSKIGCVYSKCEVGDTCTAAANYRYILFIVLDASLSSESRRLGGGKDQTEVSLSCALFHEGQESIVKD